MLSLNIFTDFCNWWWLAWLLPFLLGALLWWLNHSSWKKKYEDLENVAAGLRKRIAELEAELDACGSEKSKLRGDLSLCEGRYKELELSIQNDATESISVAAPEVKTASVTSKITETADLSGIASGFAAGTTGGGSTDRYAKIKDDNLQIIEGIGPKMESVLKENGISSWAVLASKSGEDLKAILDKYGDKYRIIDASDWPAQAGLASRRDFDGLIAHQKADGSDAKAEKLFIKLGIIKAYKLDDLKAVEGIGPKIEALLNEAGINTWKELSTTSVDRLKDVLAAAGARYKLADPSSWPKQAEYAVSGDWDALEEYQKFLDGGKTPT